MSQQEGHVCQVVDALKQFCDLCNTDMASATLSNHRKVQVFIKISVYVKRALILLSVCPPSECLPLSQLQHRRSIEYSLKARVGTRWHQQSAASLHHKP